MYKQIAKITFVTFIWKKYKHIIVSTLFLFAYLYLAGNVHRDYLSYLKLEQNGAGTGMSFIIKWFAMLAGVGLYIAYNLLRKTPDKKSAKHKNTKTNAATDSNEPDPFDNLRHDQKLRSRADLIIEKNINKK